MTCAIPPLDQAATRVGRGPEARARRCAYQVAYRASAKGRAAIEAWLDSERGRAVTIAKASGVALADVEALRRATICYYCGTGLDRAPSGRFRSPCAVTIDHKVPISRGGTHERTNLVAACLTCNVSKRKRTDVEFLATRAKTDARYVNVRSKYR